MLFKSVDFFLAFVEENLQICDFIDTILEIGSAARNDFIMFRFHIFLICEVFCVYVFYNFIEFLTFLVELFALLWYFLNHFLAISLFSEQILFEEIDSPFQFGEHIDFFWLLCCLLVRENLRLIVLESQNFFAQRFLEIRMLCKLRDECFLSFQRFFQWSVRVFQIENKVLRFDLLF